MLAEPGEVVVRFTELLEGCRALWREEACGVVQALLMGLVKASEVSASAKATAHPTEVALIVEFEEGRHLTDLVLWLRARDVRRAC